MHLLLHCHDSNQVWRFLLPSQDVILEVEDVDQCCESEEAGSVYMTDILLHLNLKNSVIIKVEPFFLVSLFSFRNVVSASFSKSTLYSTLTFLLTSTAQAVVSWIHSDSNHPYVCRSVHHLRTIFVFSSSQLLRFRFERGRSYSLYGSLHYWKMRNIGTKHGHRLPTSGRVGTRICVHLRSLSQGSKHTLLTTLTFS